MNEPAPLTGDRGGLLCAWYAAFLRGDAAAPEVAAAAACFDDFAATTTGDDLEVLVTGLRRDGVVSLELVLPVPGDVRGLPGGEVCGPDAIEAGEVVLTRGGRDRRALVPLVTTHGPGGDQVTSSAWAVHPLTQPELLAAPALTVGEADGELRRALADSTRELARLDVARWSPELAGPLAELRAQARRGRPGLGLPPGHPAEGAALLARAEPLARMVRLAHAHGGTVVTGAEIDGRRDALRTLEHAARRARMAGFNAHLGAAPTGDLLPGDPRADIGWA